MQFLLCKDSIYPKDNLMEKLEKIKQAGFKFIEFWDWRDKDFEVIINIGETRKVIFFGDNYSTRDGTCIRDYIHVNDLSNAHLLSIDALADGIGNRIYNLGNGEGFSLKEVIKTASKVVGREIKVEVGDRRLGNPKALVASSKKIKEELNWVPKYPELITIIKTAWDWHKEGYFYANTQKKN